MFNPYYNHPVVRCFPDPERLKKVTCLEIGPGRGDFLFELAREDPTRWVAAIEIKRKRYEKLILRIKRMKLHNILLLHGDARVVLPSAFNKQQLESIYILFSDPWPKSRHEKHRLFQDYFVNDLARTLKVEGDVILAHDNASYLSDSRRLLTVHPAFMPADLTPQQRHELFQTFYAEKWRAAGRRLDACRLVKQQPSLIVTKQHELSIRAWQYWLWRKREKLTYELSS